MSLIIIFDVITLFTSIVAATILLISWKRFLNYDIRLVTLGLFIFTLLYSLCLSLQWSGITQVLEPFEDLIGALIPLWWAFIFYSFFHNIYNTDLKLSEDKYRTLFNLESDALVVIDFETGNILEANHTFINLYGYSKSELLDMKNTDLSAEPNETKKATQDKMSVIPLRWHKKKDGEIFPVEITVNVLNYRGKEVHIAAIRDITKRKQAEDERHKLQTQLSNAIEVAHLGPWEYDVATDTFTFNDHFYGIFRTTAEEVGGYKMRTSEYAERFLHPDDIPRVREETQKALETEDPDYKVKTEHRIIFPDGTVGHVSVQIFIVKDKDGKTVKTYGVNQDITDLKHFKQFN